MEPLHFSLGCYQGFGTSDLFLSRYFQEKLVREQRKQDREEIKLGCDFRWNSSLSLISPDLWRKINSHSLFCMKQRNWSSQPLCNSYRLGARGTGTGAGGYKTSGNLQLSPGAKRLQYPWIFLWRWHLWAVAAKYAEWGDAYVQLVKRPSGWGTNSVPCGPKLIIRFS